MKNVIKIATISSLLLIACLLISACGNDNAENFVQGNGQIDVTVTDSVTTQPVSGVLIQVRKNSVTDPTVVDSWTTDATGKHSFQETIATDYYFTFSKTGYVTQNYPNKVTPELTSTKTVTVALVPNPA